MADQEPEPVEPRAEAPPELDRIVEVVERLHRDHRVSFIAGGDEKIYAYGGSGFVAILSDRVFDGLVEIESPIGQYRIERDPDGRLGVTGVGSATVSGDAMSQIAAGLERYYALRVGKV